MHSPKFGNVYIMTKDIRKSSETWWNMTYLLCSCTFDTVEFCHVSELNTDSCGHTVFYDLLWLDVPFLRFSTWNACYIAGVRGHALSAVHPSHQRWQRTRGLGEVTCKHERWLASSMASSMASGFFKDPQVGCLRSFDDARFWTMFCFQFNFRLSSPPLWRKDGNFESPTARNEKKGCAKRKRCESEPWYWKALNVFLYLEIDCPGTNLSFVKML